jgi:hypothetical protein
MFARTARRFLASGDESACPTWDMAANSGRHATPLFRFWFSSVRVVREVRG